MSGNTSESETDNPPDADEAIRDVWLPGESDQLKPKRDTIKKQYQEAKKTYETIVTTIDSVDLEKIEVDDQTKKYFSDKQEELDTLKKNADENNIIVENLYRNSTQKEFFVDDNFSLNSSRLNDAAIELENNLEKVKSLVQDVNDFITKLKEKATMKEAQAEQEMKEKKKTKRTKKRGGVGANRVSKTVSKTKKIFKTLTDTAEAEAAAAAEAEAEAKREAKRKAEAEAAAAAAAEAEAKREAKRKAEAEAAAAAEAEAKRKAVVSPQNEPESRLENLIKALKQMSYPKHYRDGLALKKLVSLDEQNGKFVWAERENGVSQRAKTTFHVT